MAKTAIDNNKTKIMPSPKPARKGPARKHSSSDKHSFHSASSSSTSFDDSDRRSESGHRNEVAASMRKFLSSEEDDDYLEYVIKSPKKSSTRKKSTKSSSRKVRGTSASASPKRGRKKDPVNGDKPRRRRSHTIDKTSTDEPLYGEYTLNDEMGEKQPGSPDSVKNPRRSAKKLFERAVRAASPSRLRKARSKSPGVNKLRASKASNNDEEVVISSPKVRGKSPGRLKKKTDRESSTERSPKSTKKRSESPGRLKKRSESPGRLKKRSESPGRLKKRPESPGRLKKRSQSPGRLKKSTRQSRRRQSATLDDNGIEPGALGAMLDKDTAESPKKKGARSVASAPANARKEKSTRGSFRLPQSSRFSGRLGETGDGGQKKSSTKDFPLPKGDKSYSNMQDELMRYKVKRNKSMDPALESAVRKNANSVAAGFKEEQDGKPAVRRATSMRLTREMGRRGKQASLFDLVQYKEEEIHSTSYFASNHVLINRERMKRGLRPLHRNIAMDELARKSAMAMASSNGLNPLATTYVGNVCRGESIRSIHRSIMLSKLGRERQNLLNPYFQDFGVGTCKGEDGQLYMCQLFSERLELSLTDTSGHPPNMEKEET